jgi:hypothetical protein
MAPALTDSEVDANEVRQYHWMVSSTNICGSTRPSGGISPVRTAKALAAAGLHSKGWLFSADNLEAEVTGSTITVSVKQVI